MYFKSHFRDRRIEVRYSNIQHHFTVSCLHKPGTSIAESQWSTFPFQQAKSNVGFFKHKHTFNI